MNIQELSEYDLDQLNVKQNDNQVLVSLKNELETELIMNFLLLNKITRQSMLL